MKTKAIGILDSGLGGYSFYRALRQTYPSARFVFIADQANAPFGDKKMEELVDISKQLLLKFREMGIMTVLFGCNTLSSTVLSDFQEKYPDMNLISVVDLTVLQVNAEAKKILVIATSATINQQAYLKALSKQAKNAWILEIATPKLVPLIEGLADDEDIDEALVQYIGKRSQVDTIVLGCTHYPLISENIKKISRANQIDAIEGAVRYFKKIDLPQGESELFTTLDGVRFSHQIKTLFNDDVLVKEIQL